MYLICYAAAAEEIQRLAAAYITHMNNPHYSIHDHPIAELYKWSWGWWKVSEVRCN